MKIKMIISQYYPIVGGAESQAKLLSKVLSGKGLEVDVYARKNNCGQPGDSGGSFSLTGLSSPDMKIFKQIVFMYKLYRKIISQRNNIDLIHVHQALYPAYASVLAAKKISKPVIVKCSSSGPFFDLDVLEKKGLFLGRFMAKKIVDQTTCFIALNEEAKDQLIKRGVKESRIVFIPNGVEIKAPCGESRLKVRADLGIDNNKFLVICVAPLRPEKDLSTLVSGFALLREKVDAHLLIVGQGPELAVLKKQVDQKGINFSVSFVNSHKSSSVRELLRASDLFVLASVTEGISNALLEAMSESKACLASDIPGNRVLIQESKTGCLFKSGCAESLYEKLLFLSRDSGLRQELGYCARKKVAEEFSIEDVAQKYSTLYKALIGIKRRIS